MKVEILDIYNDSQLVVPQIEGDYQAREEQISLYLDHLKETLNFFRKYSLQQIPRSEHSQVDALAKLASTKDAEFLGTYPGNPRPTINTQSSSDDRTWRNLLDDPNTRLFETWKSPRRKKWSTKNKVQNYPIHHLRRNSLSSRFQPTITKMRRWKRSGVHTGRDPRRNMRESCRGHSLASKILRQWYYWPTVKKDAIKYVHRCDKYQWFAKIPQNPPKNLTSITSPWPFADGG